MDEAAPCRDGHRMRPIAGSQLGHNMPEVLIRNALLPAAHLNAITELDW
jgi:hypothetical protein